MMFQGICSSASKALLYVAALRLHGIDGGGRLRLAVKDEAVNARLLAELREALECAEGR